MAKTKRKYPFPGVEVANGRVVYRPYIPAEDRTDETRVDRKGRLAPPIKLGNDGDDPDAILRVYMAVKASLQKEKAARLHTLKWIMQEYRKSSDWAKLALETRRSNERLAGVLDHPVEINGEPATLGDLHILDVSKPLINQIKERRYQQRVEKGNKGEVHTNREISLISSSLSWACNNVPGLGIDNNPLLGIKKLKEHPNTRYVTDDEYQRQFAIAETFPNSILPIVFELTYLTAARGIEILDLKLSNCRDDGIHVNRRKDSKDNIILWSPRLRAAYDAALARHKLHKILPIDPPLLLTKDGQGLTSSGLHSAMQRLKKKMDAMGMNAVYWNLHLLKSKGVSDAEDDHIAGHKTEAMIQRYKVKKESHKPVA